MARSNSPLVSSTALVTAGVAMLTGYYYFYRNRKKEEIQIPSDLVGNVEATGSDVVRMYTDRLPNKVYIVTGATSGLGRHVATLLARPKTHVILAVRNVTLGEKVAQEITVGSSDATTKVEVWHLDLASLGSVRAFCAKFRSTGKQLDGLVNNAGVYSVAGKTMDGFQTTWQTNVMAPALLTELLLPHMARDARVIFVSSEMERLVGLFGSSSFSIPPTSSGSSTWDYAYSKACQVLHAHELTLRYQDSKKRFIAIEPGLVETNIARHASALAQWINYKLLGPFCARSVDQGCATILYCLLSPTVVSSKHYYYGNCAPRRTSKRYDNMKQVQAQAKLFEELWNPQSNK